MVEEDRVIVVGDLAGTSSSGRDKLNITPFPFPIVNVHPPGGHFVGAIPIIFATDILFPMTKLIVGLGNPGAEYAGTRHNLGFAVIDNIIAGKSSSPEISQKLQAIVYKLPGLILLKPQTFMNLSGVAVVQAVNFYKIDLNDLLVIHDDVDFELGEIKHQFDKSSAGNNGVDSIIKNLGSQAFHRLRLGIGHSQNPQMQTADHVLDKFLPEEKETAAKMIDRAAEVTLNWIKD